MLALANFAVVVVAAFAIFFSQKATRASLGKADDQLALSRKALQATTQPIVVEVARRPLQAMLFHEMADGIEVELPLRNVGSGPAFVRLAQFTTGTGEVEEAATSQNVVIPVGESTMVHYTIGPGHRFYGMLYQQWPAEFAVAVNYDDISGEQRTRTVMRITRTELREFEVLSVGLYHCDKDWNTEPKPFAGTDPRAKDR
jgi:hypothetical protein